ncbi:Adenylosuccinate synthetase [Labilithrix luteola]|uniref:Adenylosuccinate synthetase n=1 Tax=Labilithrix luteola TaxID=1391654 RepID=A0A0K1QAS6_9BACT|nr:Adenylosuccinate synthetase [Labilithrix luteola]
MPAVVIVGAQWGDEGKGKIVDIFTEHADVVVRFGGGPNAGHTLVVGNEKLIVRLVPSGILRQDVACVLAQGMVIDTKSLLTELEELERRGLGSLGTSGRLVVSDRAHAILPYHVLVDGLREQGKGAIGTTKRGVGPCYEDKVARRGVPLGAFRDPARLRALVTTAIECWTPTILALGGQPRASTKCSKPSSRRASASCRCSSTRSRSSSARCVRRRRSSSKARKARCSTSTTERIPTSRRPRPPRAARASAQASVPRASTRSSAS